MTEPDRVKSRARTEVLIETRADAATPTAPIPIYLHVYRLLAGFAGNKKRRELPRVKPHLTSFPPPFSLKFLLLYCSCLTDPWSTGHSHLPQLIVLSFAY